LVNKLIEGGAEPRQFVVEILDYLRALLLTRAGGGRQLINLPESTREHLRGQAKYANAAVLIQIIRTFNQAGADLKLGLQPQLPLELAIVETVLALQERGEKPAAPPKEQLADIITQKPRDKEPKAAQARRRRVDNKEEEAIVPPISPSMLNFAPPPVQAPPPSPKPTVSSPPPTPTYHTFDWWRDNWEKFKAFLVKQGEDGYRVSVRLKANLCQLHAVEEDKLTLRFFYSINFNLVNTPLEKKVLQQALTEFSRTPMKVYLVVIPKEQSSTRQGASQTKYQKAAEDPVVQAALKYGGRIIEVHPPNRQN
jgi:DNA polymerase-3 subunit gamma/tau